MNCISIFRFALTFCLIFPAAAQEFDAWEIFTEEALTEKKTSDFNKYLEYVEKKLRVQTVLDPQAAVNESVQTISAFPCEFLGQERNISVQEVLNNNDCSRVHNREEKIKKIFDQKIQHFKTEVACATKWKRATHNGKIILSFSPMSMAFENNVIGNFLLSLIDESSPQSNVEKKHYDAFSQFIDEKESEPCDFYKEILTKYKEIKEIEKDSKKIKIQSVRKHEHFEELFQLAKKGEAKSIIALNYINPEIKAMFTPDNFSKIQQRELTHQSDYFVLYHGGSANNIIQQESIYKKHKDQGVYLREPKDICKDSADSPQSARTFREKLESEKQGEEKLDLTPAGRTNFMCCSYDLITRSYESAAFFFEHACNISNNPSKSKKYDGVENSSEQNNQSDHSSKSGLLQLFIKKEHFNELTFPCKAFGETRSLSQHTYPTALEIALEYKAKSELATKLSEESSKIQARVWVTSPQFIQKGTVIPYFYYQ